LHAGIAAGSSHLEGGGGGNTLCLPKIPEYDQYIAGLQYSGHIYGMQYDLYTSSNSVFDESNLGGVTFSGIPAACAVCFVNRESILMIPAKMTCPDGWNKEYGGYLVSEASMVGTTERGDYKCWDRAPEAAGGGSGNGLRQSMAYQVEGICGTLSCSAYESGKELTCVVCSK